MAVVAELGENPEHGEATRIGSGLRSDLSSHLSAVEDSWAVKAKPITGRAMTTVLASATLDKKISEHTGSVWVLGFLHFKSAISLAKMRVILKERLMAIPRFASVPRFASKGGVEWVRLGKDTISMEKMVEEKSFKSAAEIDKFFVDFYKVGLEDEQTLPWWRAYISNNMDDGRSMLIFVINHAIADGPSLIASLMATLDDQSDGTPKANKRRQPEPVGCLSMLRASCGACFNVFVGDQLPGDPHNKLKLKDHRAPGYDISVGLSNAIDLAKIKEVAKKFPGATVNDVLMAVVTLTLQEYFKKYDASVLEKKKKVRGNFPISMRKGGENMLSKDSFGNLFVPGNIRFPMHTSDPCEIVWNCKRQIDTIKRSPEPILRQKMTAGLVSSGLARKTIWDLVLDAYGKVSCMLSNVVGPATPAYLGGQMVDDLSFYALAPLGLYIGLVSYCGKVSCGFTVRAQCEPSVANLVDLWVPSFERLYSEVMAKGGEIPAPPTSCCG